MQGLKKNKQKMYFAQPGKSYPKYKTDSSGKIVYIESEGENIPIDTGEVITTYQPSEVFYGNISAQLYNAIVRAFGKDESDNYATLIVPNDTVQFVVGTRIWRKSEVKTKNVEVFENGKMKTLKVTDGDTADYIVKGVLDEGLNYDKYYLQKLNHEGE